MQLYFEDRENWREWLQDNHAGYREVWLVFFKKHTGKPSMTYDAAVEEALCFGWIDSLIRRLDDDRYVRKFTPRIDTGEWSASNLQRIKMLISAGRMTEAGLSKLPPANVDPIAAVSSRPLTVPMFFAEMLQKHPRAQQQFEQLAPSYRRNLIHWVTSAKREDTKNRRLAEAITLLAQGKKLGMK